jgi:hypothetical protein
MIRIVLCIAHYWCTWVECHTTRPADNSDRDKSARMLRQLGPYFCFIILFNIYMCIIIYLFKRQLLSFSENELFISPGFYGTAVLNA